eukprot:TRINITY_DN73_c0_g2_i1.p1 TRINITY_DN73_c0_g2~~TRINITY_DN73_c0_g2_i1.p1  ORF type:complete len:624 (+),score=132.61 TRINITY_DN73_c0_g2_i1:159-1874(+)
MSAAAVAAAVSGAAPTFVPGTVFESRAQIRHLSGGAFAGFHHDFVAMNSAMALGGDKSDRPKGSERGSVVAMAADFSSMKVAELKNLLSDKGLPTNGIKSALVARLKAEEAREAEEDKKTEKEENSAMAFQGNGEDTSRSSDDAKAEDATARTQAAPIGASSSSHDVEYKAGDLALAKFEGDGRYYTVTIVKDKGDGTFDVTWAEDGSEDTASLENLKPQNKNFNAGDFVVAKCADDGKLYTATFRQDRKNGTVVVAWIQDDSEEEVLLDNVFMQKRQFKIGQVVEAKFPDDGEFYGAKITKDLGKCQYELEWDEDGDGPQVLSVDDIRIPRVDITSFEVGQKLQGTIKRVVPFGAFVDVGAWSDGMIHNSKMADGFVSDPSDYVAEDDEVTVWVTSIDAEQQRLGLTLLESKISGGGRGSGSQPRPADEIAHPMAELEVGQKLEGTVLSIQSFGVFVDVGSEKNGLVHISRLADGFVEDPADHVSEGDKVTVWVYSVDTEAGKLGLSMVDDKVATLRGHTFRVLYLAQSPGGHTVVTGSGDETLRYWKVAKSEARENRQATRSLWSATIR